MDIQYIIYY